MLLDRVDVHNAIHGFQDYTDASEPRRPAEVWRTRSV
jgi:hypothetical protein